MKTKCARNTTKEQNTRALPEKASILQGQGCALSNPLSKSPTPHKNIRTDLLVLAKGPSGLTSCFVQWLTSRCLCEAHKQKGKVAFSPALDSLQLPFITWHEKRQGRPGQ